MFESVNISKDGKNVVFLDTENNDLYEFIYISGWDNKQKIYCGKGHYESKESLEKTGKLIKI